MPNRYFTKTYLVKINEITYLIQATSKEDAAKKAKQRYINMPLQIHVCEPLTPCQYGRDCPECTTCTECISLFARENEDE